MNCQPTELRPCCDSCHWYDRFTGVCCNGLSLYCADFTDWDYVCCEYESRRYIRLEDFDMSEATKYRVCEVLGVDLEEEFRYQMGDASFMRLRLHCLEEQQRYPGHILLQFFMDGALGTWMDVNEMYSSSFIIDIINHPERITRKRIWTERDIADAKAVKRLFSWATTVKRSDVNNELTIEGEYEDICCTTSARCIVSLDRAVFPSVKPGESIVLTEILEGKVG